MARKQNSGVNNGKRQHSQDDIDPEGDAVPKKLKSAGDHEKASQLPNTGQSVSEATSAVVVAGSRATEADAQPAKQVRLSSKDKTRSCIAG